MYGKKITEYWKNKVPIGNSSITTCYQNTIIKNKNTEQTTHNGHKYSSNSSKRLIN